MFSCHRTQIRWIDKYREKVLRVGVNLIKQFAIMFLNKSIKVFQLTVIVVIMAVMVNMVSMVIVVIMVTFVIVIFMIIANKKL
jgi:ABC-type transport system involved in cytochrome bd biosynthesis fused ATPase/permease subunit